MPGRPQDVFWLLNYAAKEATYDATTAPGAIWHKLNGPGLIHHTKTEETDQDEITGHPYVSEGGGAVIEDRTNGSIEFKGSIDLLTYFYAMLFGNVATTGTTNYDHVVKWPGSGVSSPLTVSLIQATDRGGIRLILRKSLPVFIQTRLSWLLRIRDLFRLQLNCREVVLSLRILLLFRLLIQQLKGADYGMSI